MRDSALVIEPHVALGREVRDGMLCKKLRRHAGEGGLGGDSLRAVFAEFSRGAIPIRVRPCTTRAVKSVFLIETGQRAKRPPSAHLAQAGLKRLQYRWNAPGYMCRVCDFRIGLVLGGFVLHCRLDGKPQTDFKLV